MCHTTVKTIYNWLHAFTHINNIKKENRKQPPSIFMWRAGGSLTLASLMAIRDSGVALPAGGFCLSPWNDLTLSGASHLRNRVTDYIGAADLSRYAGYYAGSLDPGDPRVSPLFGDPTGLPPLLLHVGGAEVLLDDSKMFAERARAAGVDVDLVVWPGQVHVCPSGAMSSCGWPERWGRGRGRRAMMS